MSSTLLSGFLVLTDGRRLTTENPTTHKLSTHIHYSTVIQTPSSLIPAEVRTWAAAADPLLPQDTIAYVFAKLHAPASQTALLDVITLCPVGGHPSDENYEDQVPDLPYPYIIVTGSVVSAVDKLADGKSLAYTVSSSEYVRDQSRVSRFYCRFDASRPRWRNTPSPRIGTPVQIIGTAFALHSSGNIDLNVEHLTLNIGAQGSTPAAAVDAATGSPAKRRRFASAATPSSSATGPAAIAPHVSSVAPSVAPAAQLVDLEAQVSGPPPSDAEAPAPKSKKALGKRRAPADEADA